MLATETCLPGVIILEPEVFEDSRGFFFESWNELTFKETSGNDVSFVQDNQSRSFKGVLRGLHYQVQRPQGKLVRVVRGEVYDVAVDLRRSSPAFGKWVGVELSEENRRQLWVPQGCAHGFLVRSNFADFLYKTTDFYRPEHERCIRWDDPTIGINWGLDFSPSVSQKDEAGSAFQDAEVYQ